MAVRLRIEPYNPDAVDADNDGIVQEGTAWERPAATNIVDEFGRLIETGRTSTVRGSGFRVIDRDGNTVSYQPSYGTGAGLPDKPQQRSFFGSTLGESVGTLASRTGGTLEQRYGTLGAGRPADKLPPVLLPPPVQAAQQSIMSMDDIFASTLDIADRERHRSAVERAKAFADAAAERGIDRGTVEAMLVGGTYWATWFAGGGQIGALINDIATGIGDSDTTSGFSNLTDMFAIAGLAGIRASMFSTAQRFGVTEEQFNQFLQSVSDAMERAKIAAGNASQALIRAIEEFFQGLADIFTGPPPLPAFAKSEQDGIEVKAYKIKLEPYNPDAVDGDNDGIVQEGTIWERPAATRIVDALGFEVQYGKMSSTPVTGQRIVDENNEPVSYTPSWKKGGETQKPDGPPTHGISSVGDMARGAPVAKPPKSQKPEKKKGSLFNLPKLWKEPKPAKFDIPPQTYDTPLLGKVLITDGTAPTDKALIDKEDGGRFIPKRRKLHKKIVEFYLEKAKPKEEGEPKTIFFLGGGPGSGKTSMFKSGTFGVDAETVRIDPDEIKTMIPEYRKWIGEGNVEAAGLVHGESKHITEHATAAIIDSGSDFVYDTTGNGNYEGMKKRLQEMRRNGHKIVARYSTISTAKAHKINEERFKETGRKVPSHQVNHVHQQVSVNVLRGIVDGIFDDLELYDNEGYPDNEPVLVLSVKNGVVKVEDQELFQNFAKKAGSSLFPALTPGGGIYMNGDDAFKASLKRLAETAQEKDRKAVKIYTTLGFKKINGTLRDPQYLESDEEYDEIVEQIRNLDEAFDRHSVASIQPQTVFRGTVDTISLDDIPEEYYDVVAEQIERASSSGEPVIIDKDALEYIAEALNSRIDPKKPIKYRDPAYSSTSSNPGVAQGFAINAPTADLEELIGESDDIAAIPMVMKVDVPSGVRYLTGTKNEAELIFDRETGYEIRGYEVVRIGSSDRYYIQVNAVMRPTTRTPAKLRKTTDPEPEPKKPKAGGDEFFPPDTFNFG